MAVYYISATNPIGTLTGSTASTPATGWTAGNCHPALTQVIINAMTTGDEIIYNDGVHPHAAAMNVGNALSATALFTIKSRNADASLTTIMSSITGNSPMFAVNPAAASGELHEVTFEDVTFSHSGVADAAGGCIMSCVNDAGSQTFTRCHFKDITHTKATTGTNGMLIQPTTATNPRTLTFTECVFENIITSAIERPMIMSLTTAVNNAVFTNCQITNCSHTYTTGSKVGGGEGFIYHNIGTATLTIDGMTISNCSHNGDDAVNVRGLIISTVTGGASDIKNVTASYITETGTATGSQGCLFTFQNTNDNNSLENCHISHSTNHFNGNSTGCLVTSVGSPSAIGDPTIVRMKNCSAHNNSGFYGSVADGTAGGKIIATGCTGYNNSGWKAGAGNGGASIDGIDFYSGGSGGMELYGCSTYGALGFSTSSSASVFVMNNTSTSPNQAKAVAFQNCTFGAVNPATPATSPVVTFLNNNPSNDTLTVTMTNCIVRGGTDLDIELSSNAGDTLDVTMSGCYYETAPVTTDHDDGTLTNPDGSTADPLLSDTNELGVSSPCVGAGKKFWTGPNPQGANGEPFSDWDTDIGANQSTHSPFHPKNL